MEPVTNANPIVDASVTAQTEIVPEKVEAQVATTPTEISKVCFACEKNLKHTDVVLLGVSTEDKPLSVHPHCMKPGKNEHVKNLSQVHVHIEPGKPISPAKALVVKKKIKEIFKAVHKANALKQQEAQAQEASQKV